MKRTEELVSFIVALNPLQQGFLESSLAGCDPHEQDTLERYIDYGVTHGCTIEYLAQCYDLIVKDTLAQQVYFMRHRRYRYGSFAEVESLVYRNDDYMRRYMHGLALTALMWPNHAQMFRFFRATLPRGPGGSYLEIGPGHGFYLMEAIRSTAYDSFIGVDISPTSVAMTRDILSSGFFGTFSGYEVRESDFLAWEADRAFDAIVMGEVLEHVEQPGRFLERIASLSHSGTHIYVTTCIDSPAIDHIYLFESVAQVEDMARLASLSVRDRLVVPYTGLSLEETAARRLPINIALVLAKVDG